MLIINSSHDAAALKKQLSYNGRIAVVDATRIAKEVLGLPITNTTMVGALVKATGLLAIDALDRAVQRAVRKNCAP